MTSGDVALLRPPPSKADQFGLIWASNPVYLAWGPTPRNACAALAAMVAGAPAADEDLKTTPLFSPGESRPFKSYQLDGALQRMLTSFLPSDVASQYSWHSFRIYLACALLASGASTAQILALCRWLTEASLHIYARMQEEVAVGLVDTALRADFTTIRTTNIAARDQLQPDAILVHGTGNRPTEAVAIDMDLGLGEGDDTLRRLTELDLGDD